MWLSNFSLCAMNQGGRIVVYRNISRPRSNLTSFIRSLLWSQNTFESDSPSSCVCVASRPRRNPSHCSRQPAHGWKLLYWRFSAAVLFTFAATSCLPQLPPLVGPAASRNNRLHILCRPLTLGHRNWVAASPASSSMAIDIRQRLRWTAPRPST